jgi:hypothetical protein
MRIPRRARGARVQARACALHAPHGKESRAQPQTPQARTARARGVGRAGAGGPWLSPASRSVYSYLVLVLALGSLGEREVWSVVFCQHGADIFLRQPLSHFFGCHWGGTESPLLYFTLSRVRQAVAISMREGDHFALALKREESEAQREVIIWRCSYHMAGWRCSYNGSVR